jgi:peptidoglycan/xylan/chitin deacetylase (PgdA/CDA1 family)
MPFAFYLKQFLAATADRFHYPDWQIKRRTGLRIILGYHRVLPKKVVRDKNVQACMWVSPETFENHLRWMQTIGEIVALEDIVDFSVQNSEPLFALTFDDGWLDNYQYALPLLKQYSVPAKIFLATNHINTGRLFWPDDLYYKTGLAWNNDSRDRIRPFFIEYCQKRAIPKFRGTKIEQLDAFIEDLKLINEEERSKHIKNFYRHLDIPIKATSDQLMNWDQIREMQSAGITFGSHTHNHVILRGADDDQVLEELAISKATIEEQTGIDCEWFCYPNARFSDHHCELLAKTGYRYGLTLHHAALSKEDSPFYLPRFIVYEDIARKIGFLKLRILRFPFF